jgi:hypothetical protein
MIFSLNVGNISHDIVHLTEHCYWVKITAQKLTPLFLFISTASAVNNIVQIHDIRPACGEYFTIILSISHNIVMDMNDVTMSKHNKSMCFDIVSQPNCTYQSTSIGHVTRWVSIFQFLRSYCAISRFLWLSKTLTRHKILKSLCYFMVVLASRLLWASASTIMYAIRLPHPNLWHYTLFWIFVIIVYKHMYSFLLWL